MSEALRSSDPFFRFMDLMDRLFVSRKAIPKIVRFVGFIPLMIITAPIWGLLLIVTIFISVWRSL